MLEIYNEQIYDLLAGSREGGDKLDIKEGPQGVYVGGLMVKAVGNSQDVMQVGRGASGGSVCSQQSHMVLGLSGGGAC